MTEKKDNIHRGHRQRLKARFLREGIDGFDEHTMVELLLYFGIPYKDTNDIAHALIERFGSISGVLDARYEQLLSVEGVGESEIEPLYALNEVSIQRLGATMISVEATIDGNTVSTYNGDGVILSTPTGSTAYSLSAGGPILAPSCHSFLLTPLAPHNLTMRPIVMPDTSLIELRIKTRHGKALVSIDNRTFKVCDGTLLTIKKAKRYIRLAVPRNISFFDSLRNKMMWGVDNR